VVQSGPGPGPLERAAIREKPLLRRACEQGTAVRLAAAFPFFLPSFTRLNAASHGGVLSVTERKHLLCLPLTHSAAEFFPAHEVFFSACVFGLQNAGWMRSCLYGSGAATRRSRVSPRVRPGAPKCRSHFFWRWNRVRPEPFKGEEREQLSVLFARATPA